MIALWQFPSLEEFCVIEAALGIDTVAGVIGITFYFPMRIWWVLEVLLMKLGASPGLGPEASHSHTSPHSASSHSSTVALRVPAGCGSSGFRRR